MFRLHRAGSARLTDPSLMLRWGMLHSGYREKKFWWETIVLLRKYAIILLVTFNNRGEFQLHTALGILILVLHFHDSQHPFGHRHTAASNATLHRYEMASLLILLFMLWCASFFSLGVCTHEAGWCTFMVVLVLGSNFGLIGGLVIMYGKAWCKRNHLHKKISKFVRKSFTSRKSRLSTVPSSIIGTGGGGSGNSNGEVKLPEKSQIPVDSSTQQKKRRLSSRELMLEMTNQKHRIAEHDEAAINVFITNPIRSNSKEGVAAHTPVGESRGGGSSSNTRENLDKLKPYSELNRTKSGGGRSKGKQQRAKRLSKVMKLMKGKDIEILTDEESGRKYSHNMLTNVTKWLDGDEVGEVAVDEIEVLLDENTAVEKVILTFQERVSQNG